MRLRFDYAWLGGSDLSKDVVVEMDGALITAVNPTQTRDEIETHFRGIVVPGLVSTHSHAFHRALRGRATTGAGDFWSWRQEMYRVASRLEPDLYEELAVLVFAEMVASGITSVGEFHYLHHKRDGSEYPNPNAMGIALAKAASRTGIRLTLIDTVYLQSDVDGTPPLPEQARFADGSVDLWESRVRDLAVQLEQYSHTRLGVAAHSVRAVSPTDLTRVADVAASLSAPLHIHVSEQLAENQRCVEVHGITPLDLLDRSDFLGPRTTLVHATHVSDADVGLIAGSGAGICLCPATEADLGDGIAPTDVFTASGVPLSLGTDSNAMTDILVEARLLEHHDRLRLGRRSIHPPEWLLQSATANGAAALGWTDSGRLEEGARADLVVLDDSTFELAGTGPSVAAVVLAASRASVSHVMVDGSFLIVDGEPVQAVGVEHGPVWDRLYS